MSKAISINFSVREAVPPSKSPSKEPPQKEFRSGHARRTFKRAKRLARVRRAACGTRVSCRRCIPHARGRAIKRMQIKTFYLNDNITLVDATALA